MKKFVVLIISILIITGCKVEYNLVINDDFTVSENVSMTGTDEFFALFYKSSKMNVVNMFLDEGRKGDLIKNNYKYEIIEKERPYVIATKNYNNLEEFANNTIFLEQYFDSIEVLEENGIIKMQTKNFKPIFEDSLDRYVIKATTIKITSPFEILENNALEWDKKNNIYTWYIDDNTEDFSLVLAYNPSKKYQAPGDYNLLFIISGAIMIICSLIAVYALNKKNK